MHDMAWPKKWQIRTRSRPYLEVAEVCQVGPHPLCEHHRSFPGVCSVLLLENHVFQHMSEAKVPSSDRSHEGDTCSILLSEGWCEWMCVATTSPQRVAQCRVPRHIHLHAEWITRSTRRCVLFETEQSFVLYGRATCASTSVVCWATLTLQWRTREKHGATLRLVRASTSPGGKFQKGSLVMTD